MANPPPSDTDLITKPKETETPPSFQIGRSSHLRGRLNKFEFLWRDNYNWLLERGYQLRSRYQPDWKPSWEGTSKRYTSCSDGIAPRHGSVVDAQRSSDGELLILKRTTKSLHPYEAEIGRFFSSDTLATDPRNHCVPIYDVLQVPDNEDLNILVMPLLKTFDEPRFDTVGEAVEFFRQIFEGMQFMHQHNVAHRDATYYNILMDARPMYTHRYHPFQPTRKLDLSVDAKYHTRTSRPVKYYLADFGLSRKYSPESRPPMEDIIIGGDKSVPEFETAYACDPFPTDVYTLGNLIKENFTEGSEFASPKQGFDFMKPLIADMTQADPTKRPTMDDVVERFEKIRKGLSPWKLRSRVVQADDGYVTGFARAVGHWTRCIFFVVKRVHPLPTPS